MAFIIVGLLLLAVAQHPFGTYPLSLLVWRFIVHGTAPITKLSGPAARSMSVLCCCHNEERAIREKVENLLVAAKHYPGRVELLFHLDNCSDRTAEILSEFGDAVRVIVSETRAGKSVGMARLQAIATGEILVFTDANTFIAPDALLITSREFGAVDVGGVSGRLTYSNPESSLTALVNDLYWRFEEWLKGLESDTGTMVGADGSFFAIRRELYCPTPADIIDDLHTSMSIAFAGRRMITSRDILTFEKTSTCSDEEFKRKVRISCRAFNAYRFFSDRLHGADLEVGYKFYSHRVLRWLSPLLSVFALLSLLSGLAVYAPLLAGLISVSGLAVLALGRLKVRLFSPGYEVALAFVAVSFGVWNSLRGRRFQTWDAAASGR